MFHRFMLSLLKQYFGYDSFRPLQEDIITTIRAKRDCLVVMPTGAGKSLCFQLPALAMDGVAIVISPLIALMQDQVSGLKANGIRAAFCNSSQSFDEQQKIFAAVRREEIKLLYVAPERLVTRDFYEFLQSVRLSFFVIDEAHCVSMRGHDFRPEYAKIHRLTKQFSSVGVVALTATADGAIRDDICTNL